MGNNLSQVPSDSFVRSCTSVVDHTGESLSVGAWVLTATTGNMPYGSLGFIGQIKEILQIYGSQSSHERLADLVLLETYAVAGPAPVYQVPMLRQSGWTVVPAKVCRH